MLLEAAVPGIGRVAGSAEAVGREPIEAAFGHFEPSFSAVMVAAEGDFEQLVGLEAVKAVARRDWRS